MRQAPARAPQASPQRHVPVEQAPKSAFFPALASPPLLGEAISESCCSRFALSQDLHVGVSPDITRVWNSSPQERQR